MSMSCYYRYREDGAQGVGTSWRILGGACLCCLPPYRAGGVVFVVVCCDCHGVLVVVPKFPVEVVVVVGERRFVAAVVGAYLPKVVRMYGIVGEYPFECFDRCGLPSVPSQV